MPITTTSVIGARWLLIGIEKLITWAMVNRKIKWSDLWHNDVAIKFLIPSVYDTLPSPLNLHLWKKTKKPSCQLCGRVRSLKHVLSSCQTALVDGDTDSATIKY